MADRVTTVRTVGHGTISADEFSSLLHQAGIGLLVDVRSFPGSRHNPQYGREKMESWLPRSDITYKWMQDLGGRRKPVPDSKHIALRNESFRAYADYMETPSFLSGIDELLDLASVENLAVMCSETVWWRCHRRLLSDYLTLVRGVRVEHLMHDGRLTPHPPTDGVRRADDMVIYDIGATPELV